MRPAEADIGALLEALAQAGVEHIVVGGVAALLHGAPLPTRDLDIVPRQTAENLDRLFGLLKAVDAIVREPGIHILRPTRDPLNGTGQILLSTTLGPLDLLLRLHDGQGYDELRSRSVVLQSGALAVTLLDLPALISIKQSTGRVRDRLAVPILADLLRARSGG